MKTNQAILNKSDIGFILAWSYPEWIEKVLKGTDDDALFLAELSHGPYGTQITSLKKSARKTKPANNNYQSVA